MAATSPPVLDPSYNQGYPSPVLIHSDQIVFTVDNRSLMYNYTESINQGYPSRDSDVSTMMVQARPFPKILPSVTEGINQDYPTLNDTDTPSILVCKSPHPNAFFWLDHPEKLDGYPNHDQELQFFGAFSNVPTLIKAKIPKSVKYISDYAFYNTGLTGVRIARDCRIGEHSFPDTCIIEYYED